MRLDFCGNCDSFHDVECRRFPPVPTPVLVDNQTGRTEIFFNYPQVLRDTPCCGEFRDDMIHRS